MKYLDELLIAAAIGQLAIAAINLRLDSILKWKDELGGLSLLLREVFYVHKWFITIALVIFGVITLRFAGEMAMAEHEMARWVAAGIGGFWAIRTIMQWSYYSASHWRGNPPRAAVHWILTISYGGCAATYLVVAFQ